MRRAHADWVSSINAAADTNGVAQTPTMLINGKEVDIATLTPEALKVLHADLRQVPADERLIVLPHRSVISLTALLGISSSPLASRNASPTSRVDRPRADISVTSRSNTSCP
jgi:hypothetical protein